MAKLSPSLSEPCSAAPATSSQEIEIRAVQAQSHRMPLRTLKEPEQGRLRTHRNAFVSLEP